MTPHHGSGVHGEWDSFVADKPRRRSEKRIANRGPAGTNYDVAPDGKPTAALMPVDAPDVCNNNHVVFLVNFFDELQRCAPTGKNRAQPF